MRKICLTFLLLASPASADGAPFLIGGLLLWILVPLFIVFMLVKTLLKIPTDQKPGPDHGQARPGED